MADAPPKEPRVFKARAVSDEDCNTLTELGQYLQENSFDFPSHAQFVTLLQKGFRSHISSGLEAREYELLADLRQARQAMDRIFPLGEKLWADWLRDEMQLAQSIDDRVRIMEYFAIAVKDEPSSASLWRMYGDYMYYLWSTTYEINGAAEDGWSAEDREVAKEVFKWDPMMDIWKQGVISTKLRMNDSNIVWDRYMEMLMLDHQKWPSADKIQNIKAIFQDRLTVVHATWEQTRQMLSSFLSEYDEASWEATMEDVTKRGRGVKTAYAIREPLEAAIEKASQSGDEGAEWSAYSEYLAWEVEKKGVFSFNLINGLYERATIRYPAVPSLWNDYVEFLIINAPREFEVLPVMERGTRHCPWSGDLWSHRLLTMELENSDFEAIERTKHHATSTGLLDVGGMEELMKVYIAWCGCLRRRAFAVAATEDDLDIAEVAIRSALEHVKQIGEKKYGQKFAGDPHYRLERIHIKFLTQRGDVKAARANWKSLIPAQGNSYDFWYRYYIWEMVIWAKFAMRATNEPETQLQVPEKATEVLEMGLLHIATMDWPEQLMQMYINHCEQHEGVQKLRTALIEARKYTAIVTKRREKEAADAAAAYQIQEQNPHPVPLDTKMNGKRKRDDEADDGEISSKKNKPEPSIETASSSATSQTKRDREHTIIIVDNLPLDADEMKIRKFFRDCGTINSIQLVSEENRQVATIEFEKQEEAMFAQTKSAKPFQDRELKISFGTGTTLWVTNYPPEADKEYIRNIFKDCGEIVDIRFPSLVANVRRRFCYVQFLNPDMADKGTLLNGKDLGGPFKLVAKISDPAQKGARGGATEEGRECYVKNVYWHATEKDIKNLFSSYGKVESIRLPRNMAGKSKGMAFVVFSDEVCTMPASPFISVCHMLI
jgi:RNA recognition motif-containing protein